MAVIIMADFVSIGIMPEPYRSCRPLPRARAPSRGAK
jgi:hypothetical protein